MKLFLASEGSDIKTTTELEKYIGGFKNKSVVYIPTARNGENPFGDWKNSSTWNFLQNTGMEVTPAQLEDYKDSSVIDLFLNKDIIWFSGGAAGYLVYWIRRVELDKKLPDLLKRSLYVGSSAGSMITSRSLDICDWYIGESEPGASLIPGLGLVDFDIYPHYEDGLFDRIKNVYTGKKLYLLKNGEEIIVEDQKVTVIGEERIITND